MSAEKPRLEQNPPLQKLVELKPQAAIIPARRSSEPCPGSMNTYHESRRVADGVVFARQALEDAVYRCLTLGAGNLVVPGLAPE